MRSLSDLAALQALSGAALLPLPAPATAIPESPTRQAIMWLCTSPTKSDSMTAFSRFSEPALTIGNARNSVSEDRTVL
jgi:hypothetical protein